MTTVILLWLKSHWKEAAVAALLGTIVVGLALLYGSWHLRGAKIERLQAKLEAAETRETSALEFAARSTESAKEWQARALECDAATARWQLEAEARQQAVEMERLKLAAERRARREVEARLADAITSTECEGAVQQMAEALK